MTQQRSVLLIGTFLSAFGGRRGVSEDLAEELRRRGWKVITASARPGRPGRILDMLATTWRYRGQYACASVEVYSGPAFIWAEAVCSLLRILGRPYVLVLHGGNLPAFARQWPRRVRRLLNSAAVVTCPSQFLATALAGFGREIRVIPNGVDLGRFRFRLRRTLERRLVWLRAFHRLYDPELAVRVAAIVARSFPGLRLTLCGVDKHDGTLERVERLIAELGVDGTVIVRGPVPRAGVPEVLDGSDILLNTARVDNTPVSVIEAMASGLCIVSTSAGGLSYLIEDGREGLLVRVGDAQAMADAVLRLLRSAELASKLSANARHRAMCFDWSHIVPEIEAVLDGLGTAQG
ncbi:MAG TPA: glycosyltransferase family 4 protein [Bryobacteraceae bacterium]|nr:glycosyltransferase family 4 protein [Bryobacteraceae bacterium]